MKKTIVYGIRNCYHEENMKFVKARHFIAARKGAFYDSFSYQLVPAAVPSFYCHRLWDFFLEAILLLYAILFFSLYAFLQVLHADSVAPFCFTGVMLIDLLFWNEKRWYRHVDRKCAYEHALSWPFIPYVILVRYFKIKRIRRPLWIFLSPVVPAISVPIQSAH